MRQTTAASHILATHYNCMHKNQEVGGGGEEQALELTA